MNKQKYINIKKNKKTNKKINKKVEKKKPYLVQADPKWQKILKIVSAHEEMSNKGIVDFCLSKGISISENGEPKLIK